MGKFRRTADAAQCHVDRLHQTGGHAVQEVGGKRRGVIAGRRQREFLQARDQRAGVLSDRLLVVRPRVGHRLQDLGKSGAAEPGLGRKVGAAPIGLGIRCEKHCERPAALFAQHVQGVHINGVDVGTFFAVDFDVDEAVVHHRGDLGRFETFVRHDVAPVAGGIAHRQQDRFVLFARRRQCGFAPRPPMDGVVLVLLQVGAGLVGEAIGHDVFPAMAGDHSTGVDAQNRMGRRDKRPRPASRRGL